MSTTPSCCWRKPPMAVFCWAITAYRGENSRDLLWEEADLLTATDGADNKARQRLFSQSNP